MPHGMPVLPPTNQGCRPKLLTSEQVRSAVYPLLRRVVSAALATLRPTFAHAVCTALLLLLHRFVEFFLLFFVEHRANLAHRALMNLLEFRAPVLLGQRGVLPQRLHLFRLLVEKRFDLLLLVIVEVELLREMVELLLRVHVPTHAGGLMSTFFRPLILWCGCLRKDSNA